LSVLLVAGDSRDALIALPFWLVAGAVAGWLAVALRGRSRRLEAVEEAASEAIVRLDRKAVVTGWSPGAETLYGYESDEIVGRPLGDLLAGADAEELVGDRVTDAVMDHKRSDGRVFSASVTVIPNGSEAILVARDVGELRRLGLQLGDTEAKYRSLTTNLPLVSYVRSFDGDRATTFVSPQIDRLVGYSADEWVEDPDLFLRLVHPDDRDAVVAAWDAVDAANGLRTNYRLVARDGRIVWVRDEAATVLDAAGEPLCIQGYLLDVTERRELREAGAAAEAEARDRQRKVDFVADAASVLASSREVNSTIRQVAALAARDLAEWCVVDVLEEDGTVTRVAAERGEPRGLSTEPAARAEPEVLEVMRKQQADLAEARMCIPLVSRGRRAVGALTLVAGEHGTRYGADDLPWGRAVAEMIALAIDNSRLHAEVKAQSDATKVLTHVGDGVFFLDQGGFIRVWNPASAAITGVSAESAVGKQASDAIPEWSELSERVPIGSTREPVHAATLPLATDHGERWISISGVQFFGGTVYAFRDLTEEHRLEELKAEFIATASHELRTPLAAVYGAAQTLRRHDFALDDAGRERFISMIVDESDRLAGIVNQILLANQLEVGRLDLETEPFDPVDLVERVVESAKTHAPAHISFDIKTTEAVPSVAADKDRAQQVLVNLVDNAVKYSPGGGTVEVGLEPADGAVEFRVADEGMGIPDNEQRRIFEKFYRLDPNMTKGIGGTGLGLYICTELVERMGGRIWLESKEGKGSAFYFQLPSVGSRALGQGADTVGHAVRHRRR
jgi:PAS domain S-box-containing protein